MKPVEPTAAVSEAARQELLAAARDRLRRHLSAEASSAGGERTDTSATAEVQAFLDRVDGERGST